MMWRMIPKWLSASRGKSRVSGRSLCLGCLLGLVLVSGRGAAPELVDDRTITIQNAGDLEAKRRQLIDYVWGADGFPSHRYPTTVLTNIPSPVQHLTHLRRVDEFHVSMAPGLQGLAYHFIAAQPNRQLVVVHHGHSCTFDDDAGPSETGYGLQRTIHGLLREGYGVLGVFMPHLRPGDCTGGHDALFHQTNQPSRGSAIKYFLEPIVVGLNYLQTQSRAGSFPKYRRFHMTGLSGGGWTTTVYAALDARIECSVPVAGTIPLYLRSGGSVGDLEQYESGFYQIAGYPDLYVLGSSGKRRRQIQILVRRDDCCFGERQHDVSAVGETYEAAMKGYEVRVQSRVQQLGKGSFRLVIDSVAPSHMISHHAISTVLIPALKAAR